MPALFFRWFLPVYVGEHLSAERISEADASLLFQKYAISPREQEIIRLICKGKTNKEISRELFISLQTVKDHVYRIFGKTSVNNRVQLTNLFLRPEKD